MTTETGAKVRELRTAGLTYLQIMTELGVSRKTVKYWCSPTYRTRRAEEAGRRHDRKWVERETEAAGRRAAAAKLREARELSMALRREDRAREKAIAAARAKIHRRLTATMNGAAERGLVFVIVRKDVEALLAAGVCERTGIAFEQGGDFGVSLDRIDNSRGYTTDNVQAVCWAYNRAKGASTDEAVLRLAVALVEKTLVDNGLTFDELKTSVMPTEWD